MKAHRISRTRTIALMIAALILLNVCGVIILKTAVWQLIFVPSFQGLHQADPREVVNDFHDAINSNNVDDSLALFADSAVITDNKSVINGRDQIRNWLLDSERMAELHLKLLHSEMDGEKIIWLDTAHNGAEGQSRYYIMHWEAVIAEGKIQSLKVMPRYMPDLK